MKEKDENLNIVEKIEINCRQTSLTWDKSTYKENILSGIIEKVEFDAVLDNASKILGKALEKKRKNDDIKLPRYIIVLSSISIICSVLYIILISLAIQSEDNSTTLVIISVIFLIVAVFIAFVLSIYNFCRKHRKYKTMEVFIQDDLDLYFGQMNTKFANRCQFKFNSVKNVIELVTFAKSDKMIEEEAFENRRLVNEEPDENDFDEKDLKDEGNSYNNDHNSELHKDNVDHSRRPLADDRSYSNNSRIIRDKDKEIEMSALDSSKIEISNNKKINAENVKKKNKNKFQKVKK
jgi:hypothetical protein